MKPQIPRVCKHSDLPNGTRHIPLTKGQCAIVDAADYEWLNRWNWYAFERPCNRGFYAARNDSARSGSHTILMHRVITETTDLFTDHRDGNGLNNSRTNLRPSTLLQNCGNRGKQSNNKSGFKDVVRRPGSWHAYITIDRKFLSAAKDRFGEFAKG